MTPLKVKCTICGKEESNPELVEEVSKIVKKCGLKAEHYLYLLNVMSGKCLNSDEHSFNLDEEFQKQIEKIVIIYKANLTETEVLRNTQKELIKETNELELKLKELNAKGEANEQKLNNIYESSHILNKEVEISTGIGNIEIWM